MPAAVSVDVDAMAREALVRRAQERLLRIEDIRAAHRLHDSGKTQRQIAEALRTTQPRVHRMLKVVIPGSGEQSPEEIILRATVDRTSRTDLVRQLGRQRYTFRRHAPEPFEGAVSGTWDQVRSALASGLLSRSEFERVSAAVKPPTP